MHADKPLRALPSLQTHHRPVLRVWSASEMQEAPSEPATVLGENGDPDDAPARNGSATEELDSMFPKPAFALQDDTLDIKESIILQVVVCSRVVAAASHPSPGVWLDELRAQGLVVPGTDEQRGGHQGVKLLASWWHAQCVHGVLKWHTSSRRMPASPTCGCPPLRTASASRATYLMSYTTLTQPTAPRTSSWPSTRRSGGLGSAPWQTSSSTIARLPRKGQTASGTSTRTLSALLCCTHTVHVSPQRPGAPPRPQG